MTKHTAGPWITIGIQGTNYTGIQAGRDYEEIIVADMRKDADISDEETHANARLIAAAPDLLEALIAVGNDAASSDLFHGTIELIEEAIAKATK